MMTLVTKQYNIRKMIYAWMVLVPWSFSNVSGTRKHIIATMTFSTQPTQASMNDQENADVYWKVSAGTPDLPV